MSEYKILSLDSYNDRFAVFIANRYSDGKINFWQQVSNEYIYKKCCEKKLKELQNG